MALCRVNSGGGSAEGSLCWDPILGPIVSTMVLRIITSQHSVGTVRLMSGTICPLLSSYDLPNIGRNGFANAVLHHWGLDDRISARSGFPVTLGGDQLLQPDGRFFFAGLDVVPNQPIYLYGSNCTSVLQGLNRLKAGQGCPGGRAINPNAFVQVPVDPNTGNATRRGTAPRNFVRGFGAWQMNLGVRREFPIYENLGLQFRVEAFNIFNHPNFGLIDPSLSSLTFGQATATLAGSLGSSGLNSLYQAGGSRSLQFALKLVF